MTTKKSVKSKKKIFWFEDDAHSLTDYYKKLTIQYDVSIGAHQDLIEQNRNYSFDLVLLDLMIHESSFKYDSNEQVKNISFDGEGGKVHWTEVGVEFLRRLREGEYETYGFPKDIPVIAATARIDSPTQETVKTLGVNAFLIKPFTMDKLNASIEQALNSSNIPEV